MRQSIQHIKIDTKKASIVYNGGIQCKLLISDNHHIVRVCSEIEVFTGESCLTMMSNYFIPLFRNFRSFSSQNYSKQC